MQDALTEQALLTYESAVLGALKEVEDALDAFTQEKVRQKALRSTVVSSRRSLELALRLYKEGLQDFSPCWTPSATCSTMTTSWPPSRGQVATNLVNIYQAWAAAGTPPRRRTRPKSPRPRPRRPTNPKANPPPSGGL